MSRRLLAAMAIVAAVACAPALTAAGSAVPAPAGAPSPSAAPPSAVSAGSARGLSPTQGDTTGPPLQVAAVSPWVAPDGMFQVRFAPSTDVPEGASLQWSVHQRLRSGDDESLRDAVDSVMDGGSPGPVLRPTEEVPVVDLGDPTQGIVLEVPIRSARDGSDRVLLPTPGIHPVSLRLVDGSGRRLWTEVVFLNRLPADPVLGSDDRPGVVRVSLVLPVDAGPTIAADGSVDMDVEERAALASAQRLLAEVPDAPLALAIRPNLVDALVRSDEPADERALTVLSSDDGARAVRQTYVAVDSAGLVDAGARDELVHQVHLGDRVLRDALGSQPRSTTWWLDDTVGPDVLPVLRSIGVRRLVLSPDRLRLPAAVPAEAAITRTVGLEGTNLVALGVDGELTLRLVASGESPGMRAHTVVTDLMASWFTAAESASRSFPGPASAILVPAQTDPATLRSLVAALEADGPLRPDTGEAVPEPAELDGRELTASLAPRTPADQTAAVEAARDTARQVSGYRSMTGEADPVLPLWDALAAESLSDRTDPGARAVLNQSIRDGVAERVGAIVPPPPRRVVLTSREQTIPLRFRNGLPFPARVELTIRSPRLDVAGGESRVVTLEPGGNLVELPVIVRAPGESLLRIEVTSPDGSIVIPAEPVPVAATTISGVGAALSVLSLVFLGLWWLRTHRRNRRDSAKDHHPSTRPVPPALPPAGGAPAELTRGTAPPHDAPDEASSDEPPDGAPSIDDDTDDDAGDGTVDEPGADDAPAEPPVHAEVDRG